MFSCTGHNWLFEYILSWFANVAFCSSYAERMYFDKIFASVCFIICINSFVVSLTLIGPNKLLQIALYLVHWVRKYKMGQVQFLGYTSLHFFGKCLSSASVCTLS